MLSRIDLPQRTVSKALAEAIVVTSERVQAEPEIMATVAQGIVESGGNFFALFEHMEASIVFWAEIAAEHSTESDTPDTLGYFAVSARDFWSQMGEAKDHGASPHVIVDMLNTWTAYTNAIQGQSIPGAQPIDLWFEGQT